MTLFRTSLSLKGDSRGFDKATRLIEDFVNTEAEPYGFYIRPNAEDFCETSVDPSGHVKFKIDFARNENALALSAIFPFPSPEATARLPRDGDPIAADEVHSCKIELALTKGEHGANLDVRYIEPSFDIARTPFSAYRAMRLLPSIVDQVGATDVIDLSSKPVHPTEGIDAQISGLAPWTLGALVESDARKLPVLVISSHYDKFYADADALASDLAGLAHVVKIDWTDSKDTRGKWGSSLATWYGSVRCYSTHFTASDLGWRHPRWTSKTIQELDSPNTPFGFHRVCIKQVLALTAAEKDSEPVLAPQLLRELKETKLAVVTEDFEARLQEAHEAQKGNAELENKLEQIQSEYDQLKLEMNQKNEWIEEIEKDNQRFKTQLDALNVDPDLETSPALRPLWESIHSLFASLQDVALRFRRMEDESEKMRELENKIRDYALTIQKQNAIIDSLNRKQNSSGSSIENLGTEGWETLIGVIRKLLRKETISVESGLKIVAALFPERVRVLDSSLASARESAGFIYGNKALELLMKLPTEYWLAMQTNGDTAGHKVFGTTYAAHESGNLSKEGQRSRTFNDLGEEILMTQHLKIGVADNTAETLRIYFKWLAEEKKIIIGHCGKHLPL